ncbi:hypothetical protein DFJ73DRAFT_854584, partial [Zopfochytrium polystomum]
MVKTSNHPLLLSALAIIAALAFAPLLAAAQRPIVTGNFSITVTNQPASNQYCVGDSIAYSLDLSKLPAANPQNQSDPTYLYVLLFGPPQDASVDPSGISRTPRGLSLSALAQTPISSFKGTATYVVPDNVKGFVGLFLRAVVAYQSTLFAPEALQASANSSPAFSIATSCNATSSSSSPSSTAVTASSSAKVVSSTSTSSTNLVSGAAGSFSAPPAAVYALAAVPVLML